MNTSDPKGAEPRRDSGGRGRYGVSKRRSKRGDGVAIDGFDEANCGCKSLGAGETALGERPRPIAADLAGGFGESVAQQEQALGGCGVRWGIAIWRLWSERADTKAVWKRIVGGQESGNVRLRGQTACCVSGVCRAERGEQAMSDAADVAARSLAAWRGRWVVQREDRATHREIGGLGRQRTGWRRARVARTKAPKPSRACDEQRGVLRGPIGEAWGCVKPSARAGARCCGVLGGCR